LAIGKTGAQLGRLVSSAAANAYEAPPQMGTLGFVATELETSCMICSKTTVVAELQLMLMKTI
jgi:hypothetical protein